MSERATTAGERTGASIDPQRLGYTGGAVVGMVAGLVTRESGIVVPTDLEAEPDKGRPDGKVRRPTAYDPDKRRRIVLTDTERRKIDAVIVLLKSHGLGLIVGCADRFDGRHACGEPLIQEGQNTNDKGFGCRCSRVHFL